MSEKNRAVAHRLVEAFNDGDLDRFDELVAPDFLDHSLPPGFPPTREGMKQSVAMIRGAFPDLAMHVEQEIAEGDFVAFRFTAHGTHQGDYMGIPATGKEMNNTGILIARIANGKVVERWEELDTLGVMVQLGVVPTPGG
jgi:steroid delta-isomerase-like uncharacterized protein